MKHVLTTPNHSHNPAVLRRKVSLPKVKLIVLFDITLRKFKDGYGLHPTLRYFS